VKETHKEFSNALIFITLGLLIIVRGYARGICTVCGAYLAPYSMSSQNIFPGVNQPDRETGQPPPCCAEFNTEWKILSASSM
jgi:hypothetical protein